MTEQREAVAFLVAGGLSVPRACTLVQIARSTFRYVAQPRDDSELLAQIREMVARNPRYGYRRVRALLRRTSRINEKRVRRLWRQERLQVQRVRRRRVRPPRPIRFAAAYPGHIWAYDFVEDALAIGPVRIHHSERRLHSLQTLAVAGHQGPPVTDRRRFCESTPPGHTAANEAFRKQKGPTPEREPLDQNAGSSV